MNKDFTEDMKPILLAIKGSFHYYCGDTQNAFRYLATAFLDKKSDPSDFFEWPLVIEDNFNSLLKNIKKNIGINKLLSDDYVIFNNKILSNAWIQWGILIESVFCQMAIKDIQIGLLALKCYIIASKLVSKKKCNTITARVCITFIYI